jgi:hypothetical protein
VRAKSEIGESELEAFDDLEADVDRQCAALEPAAPPI